ncbi:MAG: 6-bladed beta-propeller [Planctomycetota bacterium]
MTQPIHRWILASWMLLTIATSSMVAQETTAVTMGSGIMTFRTVPGWGLRPDGNSAIGPTHGSVVIDRDGNVYTSSRQGVFVFSPDGIVVRSYLGSDYGNLHDMEIRVEGNDEFIYGARNANAEGIKFNARSGEVMLRLPFPEASGLKLKQMKPTAITVADDGTIYLSDGYGSNHIFVFEPDGTYRAHFGEKGNGMRQFNTAHGMTIDRRYQPHRLLICDRNHEPHGRLVHYSLEGEFISEVVTGLGKPTSVAIHGDYVSVPDLTGRVVILNGDNVIMSVLGFNSDPKAAGSYRVKQADWVEGVFTAAHGSYWDAKGNLYVQDWNIDGRITKLQRVDFTSSISATRSGATATKR